MGKGGSKGGELHDYYGSIAGVACVGPVDELVGHIVDGKLAWPAADPWADGISEVHSVSRWRQDNIAAVQLDVPHKLQIGDKVTVTGFSNGVFNVSAETVTWISGAYYFGWASVGADIPQVTDTEGRVTKHEDYEDGDLVKYQGRVWTCVDDHLSDLTNAPPNYTYWSLYSLKRADAPANPAPLTIEGYGSANNAYLYWGLSDQELDTVGEQLLDREGHPPYRRMVVMVLKGFLFGRERQSVNNHEVVLRRKPNQTLITGDEAELDADGQANPIAALADIMTDTVIGAGLPGAAFNQASWQATAEAIPASLWCSPMIEKGMSLRAFVAQMLQLIDGWMRFDSDGLLEVGRFLHNEAPPGDMQTVNFHDAEDEIEWDTEGWDNTANETVVKFTDRNNWKDGGETYRSPANLQIVGEPRQLLIERPWITRREQAAQYAAEWGRLAAEPFFAGSLTLRAEKVREIKPGSLFILTHDAAEVTRICRCIEKTIASPPAGRVTIRFQSERGIAPLPYKPTTSANDGTDYPPPELIQLYEFVQPPPVLAGGVDFALFVLAARTKPLTTEMRVWLQKDDSTLFYQLGGQRQWAVHATLNSNYDAPADQTTAERSRAAGVATIKTPSAHGLSSGMRVQVSSMGDGSYDTDDATITVTAADEFTYPSPGSPESTTADADGVVTILNDDDSETLELNLHAATLAADLEKIQETQTEDAVNDGNLLLWIFDESDRTRFEIISVRSLRLDSGVYKVKGRRARFGSTRQAFSADDRVWIIHRSALATYTQEKFASYAEAGTTATFRLQGVNAGGEADLTDEDLCPDIGFDFSDAFAPEITWQQLQRNGSDITDFDADFSTTDTFRFAWTITDRNGDATEGRLVGRLGGVEKTLWAQSFPAAGTVSKTTEFSLPSDGEWRIFAIAKDSTGRVTEQELEYSGDTVTLKVGVGSGSTVVATPLAQPHGGSFGTGFLRFPFYVGLSCSTPGATIKYQIVPLWDPPGSWAGAATYSGAVTVQRNKTLHARAGAGGMTDSSVMTEHYEYDSGL